MVIQKYLVLLWYGFSFAHGVYQKTFDKGKP